MTQNRRTKKRGLKNAHSNRRQATAKRAVRAIASQTAGQSVRLFGREVSKSNLIKLAGLAAFFVVVLIVLAAIWPLIGELFEEGGVERTVERVRSAGPAGVLILLGMQFLQIVVAFIPGEVVQMAAGAMYGPWLGALIILIGCMGSSWVVYQLVHRLGQPFVEDMVPTKYLDRFREFEKSGKLAPLVFVLFVIPGLPKDTFTYLVPLTAMPVRQFLTLTTIARIPGVLMSTYAAAGLMNGNVWTSIVIIVVVAVVALVAVVFKDKIFALLGRM